MYNPKRIFYLMGLKMAIRQLSKLVCAECNATFANETEMKQHFHAVHTIGDNVYLLVIPDNVPAGTWAAVEAFQKAIAELKTKVPGKKFQFLDFHFQQGTSSSGLASIMAISED